MIGAMRTKMGPKVIGGSDRRDRLCFYFFTESSCLAKELKRQVSRVK